MRKTNTSSKLLLLLLMGSLMACETPPQELTQDDVESIRATMKSYRQAWLNNDTTTILNTLSSDITLFLPGSGPDIAGKQRVKDFWFPPSDLNYPIRTYEISDEEIFGSGIFATVQGKSFMVWETRRGDSLIAADTSRTGFLTLLKKEGDWKIYRQMFVMKE